MVTRPATVSAGRSLPAELTREGAALLDRMTDGIRAAEQRVLGALSEHDQRELRRILAELGLTRQEGHGQDSIARSATAKPAWWPWHAFGGDGGRSSAGLPSKKPIGLRWKPA